MAKDGTARGGARVGAGRRPKALADKIALGRPAECGSHFPSRTARNGRDGCPAGEGIHEGFAEERHRALRGGCF